jgi:drug/metabolite transporter (DMT)-like permease
VGPSEAAILSTFEPPVTVALAFVALGERLTVPQLFGGAMVLAAVVLLQLRPRAAAAPGGRWREPETSTAAG